MRFGLFARRPRHLFTGWGRIVRVLVVLATFVAGGAEAESVSQPLRGEPDLLIRVTAEEAVYDKKSDQVSATGEVVIEKEGLRLSADTVRFSPSTQQASAEDDVRMTSDEGDFSGSRLDLNLGSQTGTFTGGTLFFKENNLHVRAGKITKTGADAYLAEDAVITTCDGDAPAWELEGQKLDITVGGYGVVNHAFFRLGHVPVLYTPYMAFPVKRARQSGLLSPSLDYSERKGFLFSQPVYWAINGQSDATLYLDYISRRGVKLGTEYRYFLSDTDKGTVLFDFLDDLKVDDGTGTASQEWGYTSDRYLRPESERYWLRMKHDQALGAQSALKLDIDIVSDQDYLNEFKQGNSGYEASNALFVNAFNRQLDDYTERVRKNRLGFSTLWPGYALNAEALWWDDVIARTQEETDDTVQSLPVIHFDGYRQKLFGTPLYAGFETQSAYLYREDGIRGERIDLYPRIYLPYRLGRGMRIEPSLGGRETLWQIDRFEEDDPDTGRTRHRELYDFGLDISSDLYHVFTPGWGEVDALKHAVKFQVAYDYTPTLDQEDYPYFDGVDRIDGENLITYSMVNTFTTRSGEGGEDLYHQVARFELSQSYDIDKERGGDPEPFNPVEADLQLDMGGWGYLQADAAWSTYSGEVSSHNIAYRLSDARGDRFSLQHRYAAAIRETLNVEVTLKLTDRIWLYPQYETNLKDDHMVGRGVDLVYRGRCWSLEARYEEEYEDAETQDWHVGLTVTFYGLGEVGSGSLHDEGLPSWAGKGF